MSYRISIVFVAFLCVAPVAAQALRSGIRISFTQIDRQSGASGSAFLPVSTRDVETLPPSRPNACAGARAVRVAGNLPRGPIQRVVITVESLNGEAAELRATGCPRAWVETTLADGTVLAGGHGEVRVTQYGGNGEPLRGSFSQTAQHDGAPTTIRGEFVAALPSAR